MLEATPEARGKHRGPGGHCKEGLDQKDLGEAAQHNPAWLLAAAPLGLAFVAQLITFPLFSGILKF